MQRPEGRVPSHCFGYTKPVSNNSTEMYINETESELVRELFNRYVNLNEGFSTIRDDWNSRGVHVFKDKKVNIKTLKRMIDNKMYIGTLEMGVYTKADVRADTIKGDPLYVCHREDLRIVSIIYLNPEISSPCVSSVNELTCIPVKLSDRLI